MKDELMKPYNVEDVKKNMKAPGLDGMHAIFFI